MLTEFKDELAASPYRPKTLSDEGWRQFPRVMEQAINSGDDVTLAQTLNRTGFFRDTQRRAKARMIRVRTNPGNASKTLALTEFNTWYVRGLCRRLVDEGVKSCEVYRAGPATNPRCECTGWEGRVFSVRGVYDGHRARYHGAGANPRALSIPSGPNCHHSIRRLANSAGVPGRGS